MSKQLEKLISGNAELATRLDEVCRDIPLRTALGHGAETAIERDVVHLWESDITDRVTSIFSELVIAKLPRPHVITVEELCTAAMTHLGTDDENEFEARYESFLRSAISLAESPQRSEVFFVSRGLYDFELTDRFTEAWDSQTGLRVIFVGLLALGHEEDYGDDNAVYAPKNAYFAVEGSCSPRALLAFQSETRRVLSAILTSISLTRNRQLSIYYQGPDGDIKVGDAEPVDPLLDAYFSTSSKKDTIDRRIRNALHLLVLADEQQHDAISLALSVSAIESLLCKKGSEISTMFADNAATLLEPDLGNRAEAAKFFKKLYNARSETLHGTKLEHEGQLRTQARQIAAAVLLGIRGRREFQRKMGNGSETPDQLLDELREQKWTPGETVGVGAYPVRHLWAEKS